MAARCFSDHTHRPIDMISPHLSRRPLTDALDREWRRLRNRPASLRCVRIWQTDQADLDDWAHRQLRDAADLDDVVGLLHRRRGADADRLLHWLLLAGRTEPLAQRIVLQRLVPLAISEAARCGPTDGDGPPVEDLIAATVIAVAGYETSAVRPNIAPRLVDAAVHEVVRKPRRRRSHTAEFSAEHTRLDTVVAPEAELDPIVATTRVLAAGESAGVDHRLLDVARRLACGDSTNEIAAIDGCSARTVRNRRRRAAEGLRAVLDESWIDWSDPLTGLEFQTARPAA